MGGVFASGVGRGLKAEEEEEEEGNEDAWLFSSRLGGAESAREWDAVAWDRGAEGDPAWGPWRSQTQESAAESSKELERG